MHRFRYTTDRWEELRPQFVLWAKLSGVSLALAIIAVACTYGADPIIRVEQRGRTLIAIFVQLSSCAFLISGGMLLWVWLVDRFGDRPPENNR